MCENRDRAEYGKPSTNEKQFRRTKPVATSAVSLARMNQESTPCWVNCASAQIIWCVASQRLVPTDARRLARHLTHVRRGGVACSSIQVLTPSSTRIILKSYTPLAPMRLAATRV